MGKSTTADFFRKYGVPVWDADATVHTLYSNNETILSEFAKLIPNSVRNNVVDRNVLRQAIKTSPDLLPKIEAIVHPIVAEHREKFINSAQGNLVVCDIPLLYETNADQWLDGVLVVSAPIDIQRERVLKREGMTPEMFEIILAKQVPDSEKRARADFIIKTVSLSETELAVKNLIREIRSNHA